MSETQTRTHLIQIGLDARRLTKWALDRRLDPGDLGYCTHALLCDAVGDARPQPFTTEDKSGRVKVLGYGSVDAAELQMRIDTAAEPAVAECILDVASKPLPAAWPVGRRMGFKLRVAPTRQSKHPDGKRLEGDAILFEDGGADREEVYRRWLLQRLGTSVVIEDCEMRSFRQIKACRRAVVEGGRRPAASVMLPDVTFEGTIRVEEPQGFSELLRSGVGRHKAFGFGALMLRQASMA